MLAHRTQRWPSIKSALVQRLMVAGLRTGLLVVTAGDEYQSKLTQCLLNAGPASQVLGSIHTAVVSTSC